MLFLKALAMGLAIAAPVGPIGALCIQRALHRGFWAGAAGGLGTALADAFYASLAALGFASFAAVLTRISTPLGVFGGLFLLWLAMRSWPRDLATPKAAQLASATRGLLGTSVATFALTLTNPATILSFAAIFAGLGLAESATPQTAAVVVLGVFLGSMGWWIALSGTVALLHRRLPAAFTLWVGRVSALMMAGFGLWAIGHSVLTLVTR